MSIENITDQTASNFLSTHPKVVVKFFAGWCGSCRLFAPKFKRLSNDERFAQIQFAECDAEENPEVRKAAGVNTLPYFAIYQDGQFVEGVSTNQEDLVVELITKLNTKA